MTGALAAPLLGLGGSPSAAQSLQEQALGPVAVLAVGALAVLLLDLFVPGRARLVGWVAVGVGAAALALLPVSRGQETLCSSDGTCSFSVTGPTPGLQLLVLSSALVVALLSVSLVDDLGLPAGEYYFLLLASLVGAVAVPATRDFVSLLVALEVVTLPTIALVALPRRREHDEPRSGEGALKLFLWSVVSVAVTTYGLALLYGATGSLRFDQVALALADPAHRTPVAAVAIVLVLAVLLFKVAAVPWHVWAPDAYQVAPVPVAAYLSVVSKIAGFAGLALAVTAFAPWSAVWAWPLALAAVATMLMANVAALRQRHAVRLLAWSSVAQAGYVVVPFAAAVAAGRSALPALTAVVAYLAVYAAMNLGAFAVVALVARRRPDPLLADFDGLARHRPVVGVTFVLFLAALAGLPPGLAGLFAKVGVLAVPVGTGAWFLAAVTVVASVVGVAYYLPFAARVFRAPKEDAAVAAVTVPLGAALVVTAGVTVVLSLAPLLAFGLAGW
jgi:NADH-quinone oxidoreductase subunit N